MCIVAIDYDGTISADFDAARDAIQQLINAGHTVVIWSSRNNPEQHPGDLRDHYLDEMKRALFEHRIPHHRVDDGTCGKFHAQVYIDDKAIRFDGNWDEIVQRIF